MACYILVRDVLGKVSGDRSNLYNSGRSAHLQIPVPQVVICQYGIVLLIPIEAQVLLRNLRFTIIRNHIIQFALTTSLSNIRLEGHLMLNSPIVERLA